MDKQQIFEGQQLKSKHSDEKDNLTVKD